MKKFLCILILTALFCTAVCADFSQFDSEELSEAISILKACDGEPDEKTLEKLYNLGLSDEDIDGLAVVNSLRKDENDITPYIATATVITALSAAAVICVVKSKKKE